MNTAVAKKIATAVCFYKVMGFVPNNKEDAKITCVQDIP